MNERIQIYCKKLKLGRIGDIYDQIEAETYEEFLLHCLEKEVQAQEHNKVQRLIKKAGFSQLKTLEDYDESWAPELPSTVTMDALKDLFFLENQQNVMMVGSVGTGKSHLSTALGVEACRRGKEVRFYRVNDLVSKLLEKHRNGTLHRFMQGFRKAELIILDELGFVPFHKDGSELLFSLIAECYENISVIVTSNLEFGQWNTIFGDKRLTAAIMDRLVHHAHIITFAGESYRLTNALSKSKTLE
ncbi:IS21-like element helper ATPase IstB [Lentibacillus cibarius]|uniref:ATP-binding protein n=1 Tax=Lentibacillus cibarius TaxID=2583219 RepID=A0A5S3QQD5_9BACI|nr:IS21-like element helper ATPase IstB [Lentibacillus cibarius]TMN23740.1 ATP-binding protein [Lentibacillus cibarius]TMN23888.1 ATP-binding protein [Lentibacillus cibarius]